MKKMKYRDMDNADLQEAQRIKQDARVKLIKKLSKLDWDLCQINNLLEKKSV